MREGNPSLNTLFIPSFVNIDSVSNFSKRFTAALGDIHSASLNPVESKNYTKMKRILVGVNELVNQNETNPCLYNIHHPFSRILKSSYTTLDKRLEIIYAKLDKVPLFYEEAKKRLINMDDAQASLAVGQHVQTYLFLENELRDSLQESHLNFVPKFEARIEAARLADKDYIGYCESVKLR